MKINIIDAPPSAGKTGAIIDFINSADDSKRFLYVSPFLDDIDRIHAQCRKPIYSPTCVYNTYKEINTASYETKNLNYLLKKGCNAAVTVDLLRRFNDDSAQYCSDHNYTLILDDIVDVISEYNNMSGTAVGDSTSTVTETQNISAADVKFITKNYTTLDDHNFLKWEPEYNDYTGRYEDVKYWATNNRLVKYGDQIMMWLFPVSIFDAFKDVYILTYKFDSQIQKSYYDSFGIEYNHLYIKDNGYGKYTVTPEQTDYKLKRNYKELITILDDMKLNYIGKDRYALSRSWYQKNKASTNMDTLRKHVNNFYKNKKPYYDYYKEQYTNPSSQNFAWTVFEDYKSILEGKGYKKTLIPYKPKKDDDAIECGAAVYGINNFINPNIVKHFFDHGITMDEDGYALVQMLQWIWRTRIREGQKITLYIPSKRMRNLLIEWIDEVSEEVL